MIEVKNLKTKYSYGDEFSVENALFENGKISGVIGKNGSGKSTLLKTLAGQRKYEGKILINEKECSEYSSMERAREVAFLPQSVKNLNMDVRTLVEHGRYPYHGNFRRMGEEDEKKINRALELTHMKSFENRDLYELSGGERQLAYLSMIIAQDSSMILMDEPTTYMDRIHQDEFFSILRILVNEGKGIVMVCHDIEQCFAYCDKIFLMEDRKLEYAGTPDELAKNELIIRRNFGIAMKKSEDEESVYPFVMKK